MIIKKFLQYYFYKLKEKEYIEIKKILTNYELSIFIKMSEYDKLHSYYVYKVLKNKKMDLIYLKLALLHDVGKNNANFLKRIIHKLGFKTSLKDHAYNGYILLKDYDEKLAKLILKHHDKDVDEEMKIFQGADDEN